MEGQELVHRPVLLDEVLEGLAVRPGGCYVDGTTGGGSHSLEIARRLAGGRLICIDKDDYALTRAAETLQEVADRVTFVRDDFKHIADILDRLSIPAIDGMLLDLGVSSFQLDDAARGFSYQKDAALDMRMDRSCGMTAAELVNGLDERALADLIFRYGEERYARRIAAAIVSARQRQPIETTLQLAGLVAGAMPAAARREAQHPAKRTFQALRIATNDELGILEGSLRAAVERLTPGGRMAVITFHSLEDRIVKSTFADLAAGCTCPRDFPVCVCGRVPAVRLVNRKPITPGEGELAANPRSRSAKLRVAEKL
ncbi:MAG: 16S rRNA (cytosine(1402)-N(4))-methyltransferase RsmH [Clostridiales bacterium]|nr:16S rRNA (cytosine(1402)-N(4))-methyltransferase RsmH [Clostridiales bacterium]